MRLASALAAITLCAGNIPLNAQSGASVWDGIYTSDQAQRGQALYQQQCAACHGDNLEGDAQTDRAKRLNRALPPLSGDGFKGNWNGRPLSDLFDKIRNTMPWDDPGKLSLKQNADILAYVLKANQFPAGSKELPSEPDALADITFEAVRKKAAQARNESETTSPKPDNVKVDCPQARVLAVTEQPHHPGIVHEHPLNRVMIYFDSGEMIETVSGAKHSVVFKAGDVRWSPAQSAHSTEFIADHPIRIIEIELKNGSPAATTLSDLDPLKADPKHYSLIFDNPQVRVLRVRFGPEEKGVLHEHKLPHIVVYLTDQARGKSGDVRLDEPMTHTEQNPLDHAVERIAIDLK